MTDLALAQQIRTDGIDVLVDLAGHTVGNRLAAFAMRPAPVQATWIGYPNTTGLAAMDFRLTDAVSDPPGAEAFCTERLIRLPHGFLCYQPPNDAPLPRTPQNRPLTFASFNAVPKYSDGCIAAWSAILQRLPAARLRRPTSPMRSPRNDCWPALRRRESVRTGSI
jgi:predicted O-linked N-acetylglucosamine transferase (SPINDLY family)